MRIVSTSYSKSALYNDPQKWLERISFYTGILEELAKEHEVTSIERISYTGQVRQNGVNYIFIRQQKEVEWFPRNMHRLIKETAPDVVLINGFIFPFQIIQLRRKIGSKPKIIVFNRAEKPARGWKKWLQKMAAKHIDAYLFASVSDGRKWIESGIINENKIREVMQASSALVRENKRTARLKLNLNEVPSFIWVGRLDANKDPVSVVKAFLQFAETNAEARLYMIFREDALLREVEEIIESGMEKKNIILVGPIAHQELATWYSAMDFIISGSHAESLGIAVLEAMSCGCIPILTRIPSFINMTAKGNHGFLYEAGNWQALLSLLNKTAGMDLETERRKTLDHFQKELSFTAIAGKLNALISE